MTGVVIELLKFEVEPELQTIYLQKDAEIWTPALANCPGFLGKEVWLNSDQATEIILVIRWVSRAAWKSIPVELLNEIEEQFQQQLGYGYRLVKSAEYQVYQLP